MFPLIPMLLIGGGVFGGLKAAENPKLRKKVAGLFKKADDRYQRFMQGHVDSLFGIKQRSQQMQEFSADYNAQEIDVNRRLGLSVVNTGIAVLGTVFYPPLLLISTVGLLYIANKKSSSIVNKLKSIESNPIDFSSFFCLLIIVTILYITKLVHGKKEWSKG